MYDVSDTYINIHIKILVYIHRVIEDINVSILNHGYMHIQTALNC